MLNTYQIAIIVVAVIILLGGAYMYYYAKTPLVGAALTPSGNVLTNTKTLPNGTIVDAQGVPVPGAFPLKDASVTKSGTVYSSGTVVPKATVVPTTPSPPVSPTGQSTATPTTTKPIVNPTSPTALPSSNAGSPTPTPSPTTTVVKPPAPAPVPVKTPLANAVKFNSSFGAATGKTLITKGIPTKGGATAYKTEQGVALVGVQPMANISVDTKGVVYQNDKVMLNTVYIPAANLALSANASTLTSTFATNTGLGGTIKPLKIGIYPDLSAVGIPKNSLSSCSIVSGHAAVFYTGTGLTGTAYTCIGPALIYNMSDFGANDKINSMTLEPCIPAALEPAPATLYNDGDKKGSYVSLDFATINDINLVCFGRNKLTSINIAKGATVTLYTAINLGGTSKVLVGPQYIPNLNIFSLNDKVQSLTIKPTV